MLRPHLKLVRWAVALAVFASVASTRAQHVILHLQNGDRIAGIILSETTNQVTLSTVWIKELTVPVALIERREILPEAKPPAAAGTNAPADAGAGGNPVTVAKPSLALLPVPAAAAPAKAAPWYKKWKGDVTVGTSMVRGATDSELYYGKASLTYSQPYAADPKEFFRNIFTFSAEYGKTAGSLSANDMGGSSKTDFDLNRKFYVYNLGAAGYDVIRRIDLHYEDGPGFWLPLADPDQLGGESRVGGELPSGGSVR